MPTPVQTKVKEYKNTADFNKDAAKMAKDGWRVASSAERTQRTGCIRFLLLGFLFPPHPHVVVSYERETTT